MQLWMARTHYHTHGEGCSYVPQLSKTILTIQMRGVWGMSSTADKAVIGLCSIAIQHIMDENYDKAQDTLRGLIMTLEGRGEQ